MNIEVGKAAPDFVLPGTNEGEVNGIPLKSIRHSSDEDHKVAELYNVWKLNKNLGQEKMGIERSIGYIKA